MWAVGKLLKSFMWKSSVSCLYSALSEGRVGRWVHCSNLGENDGWTRAVVDGEGGLGRMRWRGVRRGRSLADCPAAWPGELAWRQTGVETLWQREGKRRLRRNPWRPVMWLVIMQPPLPGRVPSGVKTHSAGLLAFKGVPTGWLLGLLSAQTPLRGFTEPWGSGEREDGVCGAGTLASAPEEGSSPEWDHAQGGLLPYLPPSAGLLMPPPLRHPPLVCSSRS